MSLICGLLSDLTARDAGLRGRKIEPTLIPDAATCCNLSHISYLNNGIYVAATDFMAFWQLPNYISSVYYRDRFAEMLASYKYLIKKVNWVSWLLALMIHNPFTSHCRHMFAHEQRHTAVLASIDVYKCVCAYVHPSPIRCILNELAH